MSLRLSNNYATAFTQPPVSIEEQEHLGSKGAYFSTQQTQSCLEEGQQPELFKEYRYIRVSCKGPVTEKEYEAFTEIFEMLSTLSYFGLFKKMGTIERLREKVAHIHPFNFLETLVLNQDLKRLFMQVKENNGLVWSKCKKNFREGVEMQHEMGNILPHLSSFSSYMQVRPDDLFRFLRENQVDAMMQALLERHSS